MKQNTHRLSIAEVEDGGLTLEVDGHDITTAVRAVQLTVDENGIGTALIETNPGVPLVDLLADVQIRPSQAAAGWLSSLDLNEVRRRMGRTGMATDPAEQVLSALLQLATEECA